MRGHLHPRETARPELQHVFRTRDQAHFPIGGLVAIHLHGTFLDLAVRLGIAGREASLLERGAQPQATRVGAGEKLQWQVGGQCLLRETRDEVLAGTVGGSAVGGLGDPYATFVNTTVRGLIDSVYGEPAKVGTMGSSLGGLIALHIADRFPGEYDFAASMSGTLGWGSIGGAGEGTMIARYLAAGHRDTALYIDKEAEVEILVTHGV